MVGPKMQAFCHDHTMLKGNHCILRLRGAPLGQKLGMILENTEGPHLTRILDLEKSMLHETRVSGTVLWSPTNAKIPHLHVHKPKTVIVETMLVIFV